MIESLQHLATSQASSPNRIFDKKKDFDSFMNDYYQYCKLNQKQAETYEELNRNKKLIVIFVVFISRLPPKHVHTQAQIPGLKR